MTYHKPGAVRGHGVRIVGGRKYNKLPSEVVIAKRRTWLLVAVPEWNTPDGWFSFKVFVNERWTRKRLWQAGIRDGVMARGKWLEELMEQHVGLYEWAQAKMIQYEQEQKCLRREKFKEEEVGHGR